MQFFTQSRKTEPIAKWAIAEEHEWEEKQHNNWWCWANADAINTLDTWCTSPSSFANAAPKTSISNIFFFGENVRVHLVCCLHVRIHDTSDSIGERRKKTIRTHLVYERERDEKKERIIGVKCQFPMHFQQVLFSVDGSPACSSQIYVKLSDWHSPYPFFFAQHSIHWHYCEKSRKGSSIINGLSFIDLFIQLIDSLDSLNKHVSNIIDLKSLNHFNSHQSQSCAAPRPFEVLQREWAIDEISKFLNICCIRDSFEFHSWSLTIESSRA